MSRSAHFVQSMETVLSLWVVLALISAQGVRSAVDLGSATFPVKVTGADGVCPSEEQRAEIRQQIMNETLSLLTPGRTAGNPATSCSAIPAGSPSGYYWILPATGPPAVQVYCDFNRQCGCDGPSTWTRVAFLNMSDPDQNCPAGWENYNSPRACGRGVNSRGGCASQLYSVHGQQYNRVCGRILGYQNSGVLAFGRFISGEAASLDSYYLDGVSLTYRSSSVRQHIWSFANARTQGSLLVPILLCDCSGNSEWPFLSVLNNSFVGMDYFCDSGNSNERFISNQIYSDNPLWDGVGCNPSSSCCSFNNPPWFCKTLPQPITDDLEVRICHHGANEVDILVELVELYVQ